MGVAGRRLAAVVAMVAAVGCADDGAPPQTSGSPTTSAPSTPAAVAGPRVAVISGDGDLALYRVEATTRTAAMVRTLAGPAGATATSVSLSGGAAPTVCAVWDASGDRSLHCYDPATGDGYAVSTTPSGPPIAVAVSHDGTAIAWVAPSQGKDNRSHPDLYFGTLAARAVSNVGHATALAAGESPDDETALHVGALAWRGNDGLVVSYAYDADPNGSLSYLPLAKASGGWTHGRDVPVTDSTRMILGGVVSATVDDIVLAIIRSPGGTAEYPDRAVELDVSTGMVKAVVSTPQPRRTMHAVSGGDNGVLYQTIGGDGDIRTYWRNPTEGRGQPLTGLPPDAFIAVAQP